MCNRPPGDEVKGISVDPIGGPQGPYFSATFNSIDKDRDGLITWKELCIANPHVWVEDEKRVHFLEMFDSLNYKINSNEMKLYIDRIKKDLPCGSKYGRPWPYNEVPENASRKIYWSRPRVLEHRKNMSWKERFDLNRGFINYEAMSIIQLRELLIDQDKSIEGSKEDLILRLVKLRDIDSEKAEQVWRENPDNYMDGRYNE